MTATERVSTDSIVIGAKNVSGLFRRGWMTTVIMMTTNMIYADALMAFMKGFLVIGLLYHVALLFGTNCRFRFFIPQLQPESPHMTFVSCQKAFAYLFDLSFVRPSLPSLWR